MSFFSRRRRPPPTAHPDTPLARALRAARRHGRWTVRAVAQRAGTTERTLHRWEHGVNEPPTWIHEHLYAVLLPLPEELARDLALALGLPHRAPAPPPSPELVRPRVEEIVRQAAEAADVKASEARAVVREALRRFGDANIAVETVRELLR